MPSLLEERYPDLAFLLLLESLPSLPLLEKARDWEIEGWFEGLSLDDVDVLYVFGLHLGESFLKLQQWLKARKERVLIYLEQDLPSLALFLKTPHAGEIVSHPQVHMKVLLDPVPAIEELAQLFPSDRLALTTPSWHKKWRNEEELSLKIRRSSGALSALFSDVLYSHKIFANVHANFHHLLSSFDASSWEGSFANIPAIICGAGPSLAASLPHLKKLENQALILAGGSAITALTRSQVKPHLAMALDPNPEEYDRLVKGAPFDIPLLYAPRLEKRTLSLFKGPLGYLQTDTGGQVEEWLKEKLSIPHKAIGPDMGREAFSVTTLALAYAHFLGCNPIILTGVDLAYTGGKRYAPSVSHDENAPTRSLPSALDQLLTLHDRQGKEVSTLIKWVMEGEVIGDFAKEHPERRFINATSGGLKIEGWEDVALNELPFPQSYDLRLQIASRIKESLFSLDEKALEKAWEELKISLENCLKLAKEALGERSLGKMMRLQLLLSEESAYLCFLQPIEAALERILPRYLPEKEASDREQAKWQEMIAAILRHQKILACCEASAC